MPWKVTTSFKTELEFYSFRGLCFGFKTFTLRFAVLFIFLRINSSCFLLSHWIWDEKNPAYWFKASSRQLLIKYDMFLVLFQLNWQFFSNSKLKITFGERESSFIHNFNYLIKNHSNERGMYIVGEKEMALITNLIFKSNLVFFKLI